MKEIDEGCNDELVYDAIFSEHFELPILDPCYLKQTIEKNFILGLKSLASRNPKDISLILNEDRNFFREFLRAPAKAISKLKNFGSVVVFPDVKSFSIYEQSFINQLRYLYLIRMVEYSLLKSHIRVIPWIPLYCKKLTTNFFVDEIPILSSLKNIKEASLLGYDFVSTLFSVYEYYEILNKCIQNLDLSDLYIFTCKKYNDDFVYKNTRIHLVKIYNLGER